MEFVTRKITDGVARIHCGLSDKLMLGNLDAKRDWGYAGDYVEAMHLMLQQETPEDLVISTGKMHSVQDFCDLAFRRAGLDYKDYVKTDERFIRPAEVDLLMGDSSRAEKILGWKPSVDFEGLVNMMVDEDIQRLK